MQRARAVTDAERQLIAESFTGIHAERNRYCWLIGHKLGLRISEMLSLKVRDVMDENGAVRCEVVILAKHTKTNKTYRRLIDSHLSVLLSEWVAILGQAGYIGREIYLFPKNWNEPITRFAFARALRKVVIEKKLIGTVSSHSMRKTWATRLLSNFKELERQGHNVDAWLEVCRMGNWEQPGTLMNYVKSTEEIQRRALEMMQ